MYYLRSIPLAKAIFSRYFVLMNKSYIVIVVALLIGYASGSVIEKRRLAATLEESAMIADSKPSKEESKEIPPATAEGPVAVSSPVQVKTESDESWMRVNELTAELDNARAEISRHEAKIAELEGQLAGVNQPKERKRDSWSERVERMKQENPERYEAIQKARKDFQDRMEGAIADKSAFLVNIDTSTMSEEDLENHQELLARIAEGWDMMKQVQSDGISGRDQMEAMRDNYSAIRKLYAKERDIVLRQVGESMGYDKEGASDFSTYMQEVFEKTSPRMSFGGMRGASGRSSRSEEAAGK